MATFTFDTAYIVAHLQNNANEALKQRIRERRLQALCCTRLYSDLNRLTCFQREHLLLWSLGNAAWCIEEGLDYPDDHECMSEGMSFPA